MYSIIKKGFLYQKLHANLDETEGFWKTIVIFS